MSDTAGEQVARPKCVLFHKWRDSDLFIETCAKCGWRRRFTGFAFVIHPPVRPEGGSGHE